MVAFLRLRGTLSEVREEVAALRSEVKAFWAVHCAVLSKLKRQPYGYTPTASEAPVQAAMNALSNRMEELRRRVRWRLLRESTAWPHRHKAP